MYCRYCGAQLQADAQFCSVCGKAVCAEALCEAPKKESNILRYVLGALFVLAGMLPYFLGASAVDMELVYREYGYSALAVAAIGGLMTYSSFLSVLFYFTSSAMTVYAGAMLLKKDRDLKQPLILCIILHGISLLYYIVMRLLLVASPATAMSLFINEPRVIQYSVELVRSGFDPFRYQGGSVARMLISCLVIGLSILLLVLQGKKAASSPRRSSSAAGMLVTFLSLAVLAIVSNICSSVLMRFFGEHTLAANVIARSILQRYCNLFCTMVLFLSLLLPVFVEKKNWITRLCLAGVVVTAGIVMLLLASSLPANHGTPHALFALVTQLLRSALLGRVCVMVALVFWLQTVAQNRQPLWSQILFPALIPLLYYTVRLICNAVLSIYAVGVGAIVIAMILVGAALLFGRRVRR